MGKKKDINEEEIKDTVLPVANDVPSVARRLLDFDRVLTKCRDNHERLCRIRSDVIWRYRKPQAEWLRKNGYCSIKWGEL